MLPPGDPAPRRVLLMMRATRAGFVATAALTAFGCAATTFNSSWKAPTAEPLNFKGKKVAALVISKEEGVRYGAEAALAREITARGAIGVEAYSLIPKEVVQDKDKAKEFLEKAGVAGVVAMRVVGKDQLITSSPATYWGSPYYSSFWGGGYYGYGWGGVYDPGYLRTDTVVFVEILVYSLGQNKLVWAGQTQTTNPTQVGPFIKELTAKVAGELKKQGLIQ
jgi:hypothetical protein